MTRRAIKRSLRLLAWAWLLAVAVVVLCLTLPVVAIVAVVLILWQITRRALDVVNDAPWRPGRQEMPKVFPAGREPGEPPWESTLGR
jgi:Flp pilus assembly protein TadB